VVDHENERGCAEDGEFLSSQAEVSDEGVVDDPGGGSCASDVVAYPQTPESIALQRELADDVGEAALVAVSVSILRRSIVLLQLR
jgi:hypothetical protein